jgi:TonB family protein
MKPNTSRRARAGALPVLLLMGLAGPVSAEIGTAPVESQAPGSGAATTVIDEPADAPGSASQSALPLPARAPANDAATSGTPESGDRAAPDDSGPEPPIPEESTAAMGSPAVDDNASQAAAAAGPAKPAGNAGFEAVPARTAAHDRMVRLMEEERFPEAVAAAEQVVELTAAEYGEDSIRLAGPLDNLATLQMLGGDLVAAENTYRLSISLVEAAEGILSPRLVNAYIGLGATYNRAGLYEQATEAFETALRVNHVNDGFYNFEQFKIRDGLTESYIGQEELLDANFHQEIQVEIHQRKLGPDSADIAPALYKLAAWYERSGQVDLARATYQNAQRLVRKEYGGDSPGEIAALEGIASTYERQGLMSESASALKRAIEIIDLQPDPDSAERARLLVALGDLYASFGKTDTAGAHYTDAWQTLSADDALLEQRDEYFSQPVRVAGLSLRALRYASRAAASTPDGLADGFVLLRYDVDESGRISDAQVIESEPQGLLDERVLKTLERSYYRPRFADGSAVPTDGLLYRHEFRYRPTLDEEPDTDDDRGKPLEYPDINRGAPLEYPGAPDPG